MGAIDEIAGDGKGIHLKPRPNTLAERQRVRRWCATEAITKAPGHEHETLAELLDAIQLRPEPGEPA